tara:strand:- start:237 stop:338 length:102 start_codon:yes stop_codon:yes gene_type:complete
MSHPVFGEAEYCEDCYELLDEELHKCIHVVGVI